MNTQLVSHAEFVSTYDGRSDYTVYVRRLRQDVRVRRMIASGEFLPVSRDLTADEGAAAIAAVKDLLARKHAEFVAWDIEKNGATHDCQHPDFNAAADDWCPACHPTVSR